GRIVGDGRVCRPHVCLGKDKGPVPAETRLSAGSSSGSGGLAARRKQKTAQNAEKTHWRRVWVLTTIRPFRRPRGACPERKLMISVAAIRMQQFGVQFYQVWLTASDLHKVGG